MTVLRVEGLKAGYGATTIVHGVDLDVGRGEIVAVLGPNGAGKSTLLKAVAGLVPVRAGRVDIAGKPVRHLSPDTVNEAGGAFVPQERNIFRTLTVAENLATGAWRHRKDRRRRQDEVLSIFPALAERLGVAAGHLSGGQRQQLAVAMALMADPALLLLDEPTAGLSPAIVEEMLTLFQRLGETGIGMLIVEQNARAALAHSDRALILVDGVVARADSARTLLEDSSVGALFLGEAA